MNSHSSKPAPALDDKTANWLRPGLEKKASDWHFTPNERLALRVYGDIEFQTQENLTEDEVFDAWKKITQDAKRSLGDFYTPDDRSVAVEIGGKVCRFRVHAKLCNGGFSFNLRSLADEPLALSKLATPKVLIDLINHRSSGLVLVTGQTGSGKSTTLAALVDYLIESRPIKVATYEAPIEVLFKSKKGLVQQHDVGGEKGMSHIRSFVEASKSSMREDPDVIMFGELRETEAIRYALEAAETGHLVFGTLHTGNAVQSISRLIAAAPDDGKDFFLHTIATSLIGVLSQRLIPTRDKKLRGNYEVMVVNESIAGCITRADFNQINNAILTGRREGMFTFDDHLADLVASKEYTAEEALAASATPRTTLQHLSQKKLINELQKTALSKIYALN